MPLAGDDADDAYLAILDTEPNTPFLHRELHSLLQPADAAGKDVVRDRFAAGNTLGRQLGL
jgi:hypothetical protein